MLVLLKLCILYTLSLEFVNILSDDFDAEISKCTRIRALLLALEKNPCLVLFFQKLIDCSHHLDPSIKCVLV